MAMNIKILCLCLYFQRRSEWPTCVVTDCLELDQKWNMTIYSRLLYARWHSFFFRPLNHFENIVSHQTGFSLTCQLHVIKQSTEIYMSFIMWLINFLFLIHTAYFLALTIIINNWKKKFWCCFHSNHDRRGQRETIFCGVEKFHLFSLECNQVRHFLSVFHFFLVEKNVWKFFGWSLKVFKFLELVSAFEQALKGKNYWTNYR